MAGGGADAAQQRIRPLADVSESASQAFTSNSQTVSGVAHGFDQMKASLQPMPETPPHKNFFDEMAFWKTTDTERQIKDYNEVGQQNLAKYQAYADQAQSAGQGMKIDYGQLSDFGGGDVTIGSPEPGKGGVDHGPGRGPSPHGPSGPGPAASGPSPAFSPGYSGGPAAPPGGGAPVPPGLHPQGTGPDPQGTRPGDGTMTSGWAPRSANPVGGPGGGPGWVPSSTLPPGSGSGGGSWSLGLVGGFGPGGGLTGGGPGGGNGGSGTGAGGRGGSGAGRLGAGSGAGAAEVAAGRGPAGAAGRGSAGSRGASGVGGMGAGGRGKGEEDKEHQRKYGVDDDSAFDITDDEGGRILDPRTGLPPVPPTIGG
ncbi:hypothetical protein ATK36_5265 [Amycolatopsis sulphurea]|uniref:PPE family protein n=1 Tax=Amycolatopsis sulphurea TaxID=76022 RepID=A0A2A9FGL0_9PSEU|nr:hypothetical protein [Amycolatopsis sulphurea]PFG50063.1 hypothetical protein ATK36_5265 [Amycolatopsis sulphurea]